MNDPHVCNDHQCWKDGKPIGTPSAFYVIERATAKAVGGLCAEHAPKYMQREDERYSIVPRPDRTNDDDHPWSFGMIDA